jgi:hypothetical protein
VRTLLLQALSDLLALSFGLLALRVGRRASLIQTDHRAAWVLAGSAWGWLGVFGAVHTAWGAYVLRAGRGSTAAATYFEWLMPLDDVRGLLMAGYALLVLAAALLRRPVPSTPLRMQGALLAFAAAGAAAGILERPFDRVAHYQLTALTAAVTVLLLFAALVMAVVRDGMDYLLWIAVVLYAVREALVNVVLTTYQWLGDEGVWRPTFAMVQWPGVVLYPVMIALALRRLHLAARNRDVPALFVLGFGRRRTDPA